MKELVRWSTEVIHIGLQEKANKWKNKKKPIMAIQLKLLWVLSSVWAVIVIQTLRRLSQIVLSKALLFQRLSNIKNNTNSIINDNSDIFHSFVPLSFIIVHKLTKTHQETRLFHWAEFVTIDNVTVIYFCFTVVGAVKPRAHFTSVWQIFTKITLIIIILHFQCLNRFEKSRCCRLVLSQDWLIFLRMPRYVGQLKKSFSQCENMETYSHSS